MLYPVEAGLESKYVDEVWVATDCRDICNTVLDCDTRAKVYKRSEASATDVSNSEDVLLEFSEKYARQGFSNLGDFDILVFMQCTSPLTEAEDIDGALELLESDPTHDSVISCCEDHGGWLCGGFTWETLGDYYAANRITPYSHQRQEMSKRYRENGAIYASYKKDFMEEKTRLPGRIKIFEMPRARSFEIDSKEDLNELDSLLSPYDPDVPF